MAEEEKPKQLVQMSTVFASGITAIVAALFTSRLGVAGTLIGTALTPMLMTIGVAVLNASIQKATTRISGLPNTVRGQLSTQRVRIPGTPRPEQPPEEPEPPETTRRRDRRSAGFFERLRSIPTYLKEMSPTTRRRTLLTGALTGLVAAAIGLAGVTGIEAASGSSLSCSVWNECAETASGESGTEGSRPSIIQALGGSEDAGTETSPSIGEDQPQNVQPGAQPTPGVEDGPANGQYEGAPQGGEQQAPSGEKPEQLPAEDPTQDDQPSVQNPGAAPQDGVQQPAAPGAEQQPATPSEEQQ